MLLPDNTFTHSEDTRTSCIARPSAPTARASSPPPTTTPPASGMPPPDNLFTYSEDMRTTCLARPSAPTARASHRHARHHPPSLEGHLRTTPSHPPRTREPPVKAR